MLTKSSKYTVWLEGKEANLVLSSFKQECRKLQKQRNGSHLIKFIPKPNYNAIKRSSKFQKQNSIVRRNRDSSKFVSLENDDTSYYFINKKFVSEDQRDEEILIKTGYNIEYDHTIKDHFCSLDSTLYTVGDNCPCYNYFYNKSPCSFCDESSPQICPFHFTNFESLSKKKIQNLDITNIIAYNGLNILSNVRFDVYIKCMNIKYIYSSKYNVDDELDRYLDDLKDDSYDYDEERYLEFIGFGSSELRWKQKQIKKHNIAVYKKYNDKKIKIENTHKTITSIISLEILKNKLNSDNLSHIASFLSGTTGKTGTIDQQIKKIKSDLNKF